MKWNKIYYACIIIHVGITNNIITELLKHLKEAEVNFFTTRSTMQYCYMEISSKKENLHGSQHIMEHYIQLNME